jgi:hypothetical protein
MKLLQRMAVGFMACVPALAFAAIDVSDITGLATDVAAVGAAVLGILVAIKGIKLIRRCL